MIHLLLAFALQDGDVAEGRKFFDLRCANCHNPAEPATVKRDEVWTKLIRATTWVSAKDAAAVAAARLNLEAYMRAKGDRAPTVDASTKAKDGDGTLKPNFENGSVYLVPKDKHGSRVRLLVQKGAAVPVAAGTYRVFNYAIETEKDGEFWCLSGSGPAGREVAVKAGQETPLDLDTAVGVEVQAVVKNGKLRANLTIKGDGGMGLSLIQGEARVPVSFEAFDDKWKKLGGSAMTYGWGGGASGAVDDPKAAKIIVTMDAGPFKIDGELAKRIH